MGDGPLRVTSSLSKQRIETKSKPNPREKAVSQMLNAYINHSLQGVGLTKLDESTGKQKTIKIELRENGTRLYYSDLQAAHAKVREVLLELEYSLKYQNKGEEIKEVKGILKELEGSLLRIMSVIPDQSSISVDNLYAAMGKIKRRPKEMPVPSSTGYEMSTLNYLWDTIKSLPEILYSRLLGRESSGVVRKAINKAEERQKYYEKGIKEEIY